MRPVLLSQTPHKFYSVARNNDGEKFVRYKCEVCGIEGKRYGISEVIHLKDNAPSKCNPDEEDPMPRKKKEESPAPIVEQTQEPEPVQQSAFEGDGLDPQIAKVADRVVDLLVQKNSSPLMGRSRKPRGCRSTSAGVEASQSVRRGRIER